MGTDPRDVVWAPSAHADFDEALARRDDAAALLEEVLDAAASLSTLRERGRLVPELDDAVTREIFVRDFRLMYEVSSDHVYVIAFVNGARDSSPGVESVNGVDRDFRLRQIDAEPARMAAHTFLPP